tara:strand:- start:16463 stop:16954 length:492 start_codon:yes stop_codon:yes gene_type:complete
MSATATLYRCGLTKDCPADVVYLAGLDFPKLTQSVSGSGLDTRRSDIRGVVRELEPEQIKAIKAAAKHKFFRWSGGKNPRAKLHSMKAPGYKALEGDTPVASYVYLEPTSASDYEEPKVPTLADEDEAPTAKDSAPETSEDKKAADAKRKREARAKAKASPAK